MAAPMKPAEPTRDQQIKAKEDAIKRRLASDSSKAKATAQSKVNKAAAARAKLGKYGTVTGSYDTKKILGSKEGFSKSDYGVGAGAAIPYQIGSGKGSVSKTINKPKPKPKPRPKPKSSGHTSYKVKRGDTLSGIAKKHGTNWQDIWKYNLKNRNAKTAAILRRRGPNLIYKGGTFYIPK